ncbi:unnamed protein product, partial [Meganyctiphanes norvegica]
MVSPSDMDLDDIEAGQPMLPAETPPRPRACLHNHGGSHHHHHHHHHQECEEEMTPKQRADFAVIKFVAGLVLTVMRKFWCTSGTVAAGIIVLYWLYGGWLALLLLIFALSAVVYQISDQLVYWPNFPPDSRVLVQQPSSIGLPSENLYIYARDGTKLHAVFIKQDEATVQLAPTFIYFHGNAGNMGHRLTNVYGMYRWLGINLLLVEYRGYGLSEGQPTEEGLYLDAQASLQYLKTRTDIDQNKIIVFGRSLGGAIAIDCVSRAEISSRVAGVVVENTFTSIPDMAKVLFSNVRLLSKLPVWCHKNKYYRVELLDKSGPMCSTMNSAQLNQVLPDNVADPANMIQLDRFCATLGRKIFQIQETSILQVWQCLGGLLLSVSKISTGEMQAPVTYVNSVCL